MAELKTRKTRASVEKFLNGLADEQRRADCFTLVRLMSETTGEKPAMWGPSIVGFGDDHYTYASGREGDWFLVGFSPRKNSISLYLMGCAPRPADLMEKLGKYKAGKGCLSVKRLSDIHLPTLKKLLKLSVQSRKGKNRKAKK